VSEQAAAAALMKLAGSPGDVDARAKVVRWLLGDKLIADRVDEADAEHLVDEAAARTTAGTEAAVLAELKAGLEASPGTTLIALFRFPKVRQVWDFGPVRFGPPALVIDERVVPATGSWGASASAAAFAVRVDEPAIGTRGSRRALEWLRAGLGALYLAGRLNGGGADTRLGPVPADELAPSVFVGPVGSLGCLVEVLRVPATVPLELDALLAAEEASALVLDCLQSEPADLVQHRLRQAAPWIQFSFDALSFPDAVLGLGVALESLVGAENTSDVVRTIGMRAAFLLREGDTPAERALTGSDWQIKAKSLYKARSTVAHGRYEEGALSQAKEREIRHDFEDLVCRIATTFRAEGRRHNWLTDKDLKNWQEQLELA